MAAGHYSLLSEEVKKKLKAGFFCQSGGAVRTLMILRPQTVDLMFVVEYKKFSNLAYSV